MRPTTLFLSFALSMTAGVGSGQAEVRFGSNVRIGGHDFSHQTYNRKRRALVYLYDRTPPGEGCAWRSDGRGGRVKVCRLRRIGRR